MLLTLFRLLSWLPLPVLHAIGALLGWLVYLASPSYRRRLKDNIVRAGYAGSLRQAIAEAGKNVLELPFIWCASPSRVLKSATIGNWDMVQAALDAQRGIDVTNRALHRREKAQRVAAGGACDVRGAQG